MTFGESRQEQEDRQRREQRTKRAIENGRSQPTQTKDDPIVQVMVALFLVTWVILLIVLALAVMFA